MEIKKKWVKTSLKLLFCEVEKNDLAFFFSWFYFLLIKRSTKRSVNQSFCLNFAMEYNNHCTFEKGYTGSRIV